MAYLFQLRLNSDNIWYWTKLIHYIPRIIVIGALGLTVVIPEADKHGKGLGNHNGRGGRRKTTTFNQREVQGICPICGQVPPY